MFRRRKTLLETRTRELRDARWRLESVIEGANVGTWEWNVQTGNTVVNERWAQIVGYTLEELAPITIKTWESLAHPEDLILSVELLNRHFAGKLPYYDCECRMRHKNGHSGLGAGSQVRSSPGQKTASPF